MPASCATRSRRWRAGRRCWRPELQAGVAGEIRLRAPHDRPVMSERRARDSDADRRGPQRAADRQDAAPQHRDGEDAPAAHLREARRVGASGGGGGGHAQGSAGMSRMAELDRRQFLVGTAGGAILLRLPPEASGVSKRALRELRAAVRGRVLVPRDSTRIVYNRRFEGLPARRGGPRGEHGRRGGGGPLGGPLRRARGGPLRRPQLRGLLEHGRRRGARPLEAAGGAAWRAAAPRSARARS